MPWSCPPLDRGSVGLSNVLGANVSTHRGPTRQTHVPRKFAVCLRWEGHPRGTIGRHSMGAAMQSHSSGTCPQPIMWAGGGVQHSDLDVGRGQEDGALVQPMARQSKLVHPTATTRIWGAQGKKARQPTSSRIAICMRRPCVAVRPQPHTLVCSRRFVVVRAPHTPTTAVERQHWRVGCSSRDVRAATLRHRQHQPPHQSVCATA